MKSDVVVGNSRKWTCLELALESNSIPVGGGHHHCEVCVYIRSHTNTIIDKIAM